MCGGSKTITTITVASVAFNLNGSPDTRRKYTPTQVFGAINRNSNSLADDITGALLKGPNVKFRSLLSHAKRTGYYGAVGQNGTALGKDLTRERQLELEMSLAGNGYDIAILAHASIGQHDWNMSAAEYHYGAGTNYANDFITWRNPSLDGFPAEPTGISVSDLYAYYTNQGNYAAYYYATPTGAWKAIALYYKPTFSTVGGVINEPLQAGLVEFPEEINYMYLTSNTTTSHSYNKNQVTTTVVSYSDGRPNETTSNTVPIGTANWENFNRQYVKTGYQFSYENQTDGKRNDCLRVWQSISQVGSIQVVNQVTTTQEIIFGGVIKTTTVTVATDTLVLAKQAQRARQGINITDYGPVKLWSYQLGTGQPNLDTWFNNDMPPFFPVIPIRWNNQMISVSHPDIAARNTKLIRRGYSINYMKLENSLAEHPDLADIDHAYLFFGVPINAKDNASKLYLFKFFEYFFKDATSKTPYAMDGWQYGWDRRVFSDSTDHFVDLNDFYRNKLAPVNQCPSMITRWLRITNAFGLDLKYAFHYRGIRTGTGRAYGNMHIGEVRISLEGPDIYNKWNWTGKYYPANFGGFPSLENWWGQWYSNISIQTAPLGGIGQYASVIGYLTEIPINYGVSTYDVMSNFGTSNRIYNVHSPAEVNLNNYNIQAITNDTVYVITYQKSDNSWQQIRIMGLTMENHIYAPKKIVKWWSDTSIGYEEDSDFIIPLHEGVIKSMNFMDATEVCTQAGFVLCNCFVVNITKVKKKGFLGFLISIVVAVVAIAVAVLAPALAPGMSALFTSLGSSLGFTGMAAVIAGGAVSMLAGLVLTQMITGIASLIFGDKLGALIGAIISVAVGSIVAGLQQGQSFITAAKGLVSAEGVLAMTSSVGNGLQEYYQISAQQKVNKLKDFIEDSQLELKSIWDKNQRIIEKYEAEFGRSAIMFNRWSSPNESPDTFLSRTLLLGSDIAAITNGYVTNFVTSTITLKPATD